MLKYRVRLRAPEPVTELKLRILEDSTTIREGETTSYSPDSTISSMTSQESSYGDEFVGRYKMLIPIGKENECRDVHKEMTVDNDLCSCNSCFTGKYRGKQSPSIIEYEIPTENMKLVRLITCERSMN